MYGIMTDTDKINFEEALRMAIWAFPKEKLKILEIGVCHGDTARGIKQYYAYYHTPIEYWGVDNNKDLKVEPPFPGANLVIGPSEDVHHKVPNGFHLIFIDGCHCSNHVMLDFLNYGRKTTLNGLVVFHDVSPAAQNKYDYQGHGDKVNHETGTSTRTALYKLGLQTSKTPQFRADWNLIFERWDDHSDWGGIGVYQRIQ